MHAHVRASWYMFELQSLHVEAPWSVSVAASASETVLSCVALHAMLWASPATVLTFNAAMLQDCTAGHRGLLPARTVSLSASELMCVDPAEHNPFGCNRCQHLLHNYVVLHN